MDISELTAYAEEKYHIGEVNRRMELSGSRPVTRLSTLLHPRSGKPVALLIRYWDFELGDEVQFCDLKCGHASLRRFSEPWLTAPYRMKGADWVGVRFGADTGHEAVFQLFDEAMQAGQARYTITLGSALKPQMSEYRETPLPPPGTRPNKEPPKKPEPEQLTLHGLIEKAVNTAEALAHTFTLGPEGRETPYRDTPLTGVRREAAGIPEKLREMRRLYDHREHSYLGACKNFYVQGKFMEDYEDDAPWNGELRLYYPSYHDLRLEQLRGYFTWRTALRRGEFRPVCTSLAYIYVYELLNDIGASDAEDSLRKLREFEIGYLDSGIGEGDMRRNLRRWMLEKAVVSGLPPELAREYADPDMLKRDEALAALREYKSRTDEEIFRALLTLAGSKLSKSPAVQSEEGQRLFARVWRLAAAKERQEGKTLFTLCFGGCRSHRWDPLANALYYRQKRLAAATYELDEVRTYTFNGGIWTEKCYQERSFDKKLLEGLLHETDRQLRLYLDLGRHLREKPEEAWASAYAEAVIEEDRQARAAAARKRITVDLGSLEQIRRDALLTRDSLLTEEDLREAEAQSESVPVRASAEETDEAAPSLPPNLPLDEVQTELLSLLLRGEPVKGLLAEKHRMPTVEADAINEALYDEIGDSVLECDGDGITLAEDYREDVLRLLGGNNE